MDLAQISGILHQTLWLALQLAAPILGTALAVGLGVSILQAATQVNEQTLTFVPKIVITLAVFGGIFPTWMTLLVDFTKRLMAIAAGGMP
jgi:flagellar biosynthetic protein FliQ